MFPCIYNSSFFILSAHIHTIWQFWRYLSNLKVVLGITCICAPHRLNCVLLCLCGEISLSVCTTALIWTNENCIKALFLHYFHSCFQYRCSNWIKYICNFGYAQILVGIVSRIEFPTESPEYRNSGKISRDLGSKIGNSGIFETFIQPYFNFFKFSIVFR